jgi:glycerol-3-phosphate dehydrogenase (NAD(P)+)
MGSALATPLADAGHEVRLWGTHLDDHLIAASRAGRPHPRTNVPVHPAVTTYLVHELAAATAGADVVVIAVSSPGVADIAALAAPYLHSVRAVLLTSKGFAVDPTGQIELLPRTVARALAGHTTAPVIAVGGPCKANEVAARQPTAPIFAVPAAAADAALWATWASTDAYRAAATTDRDGVELCAALKNVYAIALGIADGLTERGPAPFHDLKSAIFAQALAELRLLLTAHGADPWTAVGLAGAGDLEVTGLSGRNKVYGVRIGQGEGAAAALQAMEAAEQTVEGVAAVAFARRFVAQSYPALVERLPLLHAIGQVVHEAGPIDLVLEAALPQPLRTQPPLASPTTELPLSASAQAGVR